MSIGYVECAHCGETVGTCHNTVTAVSQRDMRVTSGQTPEHQRKRKKNILLLSPKKPA